MLLGILKIFLALQLILSLIVADERTNESNLSDDENTHNIDENHNIDINVDIGYNEADKPEQQQTTEKQTQKTTKPQTTKKPPPRTTKKRTHGRKKWLASFKYAEHHNRELGFDLTPEEMKKFKIWEDGVIPYYIDIVSFHDKGLRDKIRSFLQMVNAVANINFVELPGPPTDDKERWVFFINRRGLLGCADHTVKNFTNEGVQQVVLGYDCMATRGEMAEAVMSILGVPAQHNAPDRDKYIKVNMDNIISDKKYLFEKLNDNEWLFHDLPYDFDSVTHYDVNKYSSNGRATIELKKSSDDLNPATEFSSTDLQKIKMLYNFLTRNKHIEGSVCYKLFKYKGKPASAHILDKRSKSRKKPSRYLGVDSKPSEKTSDEIMEGISSDSNEEKDSNDKEELNDRGNDEQDDVEDEDIMLDETAKTQLKGHMNNNRYKKYTKRSIKEITDLINQLSDYDSRELNKKKVG